MGQWSEVVRFVFCLNQTSMISETLSVDEEGSSFPEAEPLLLIGNGAFVGGMISCWRMGLGFPALTLKKVSRFKAHFVSSIHTHIWLLFYLSPSYGQDIP